jgi:hypothetical protein
LPIIPNHSARIPDPSYSGEMPIFSSPKDLIATIVKGGIVMQVITIGKKLIPAEQIAFVEAFDPASNPEFKPERDFKGRVVLLNRDTVLTEMTPSDFATAHNMRLLAEDNVAVGHTIAFRVETFTPTETFRPNKAYLTRIKWRDRDGNEQSKLLLTAPETVVNELSQRRTELAPRPKPSPRRPARRRGARKVDAVHS